MCCRLLPQRILVKLSSLPEFPRDAKKNPVFIKFLIVSVLVHESHEMKEMGVRAARQARLLLFGRGKKLDDFLSPRPRRADGTAAQVWKSLHLVAAAAAALLTQGREVSTPLRRIPAAAATSAARRTIPAHAGSGPVPGRSALTISEAR